MEIRKRTSSSSSWATDCTGGSNRQHQPQVFFLLRFFIDFLSGINPKILLLFGYLFEAGFICIKNQVYACGAYEYTCHIPPFKIQPPPLNLELNCIGELKMMSRKRYLL
uniref:Uncharacterized protein n=1 Tax=Cucumis melo TaxID=3656 RepID=A0A9I9E526_CUCME